MLVSLTTCSYNVKSYSCSRYPVRAWRFHIGTPSLSCPARRWCLSSVASPKPLTRSSTSWGWRLDQMEASAFSQMHLMLCMGIFSLQVAVIIHWPHSWLSRLSHKDPSCSAYEMTQQLYAYISERPSTADFSLFQLPAILDEILHKFYAVVTKDQDSRLTLNCNVQDKVCQLFVTACHKAFTSGNPCLQFAVEKIKKAALDLPQPSQAEFADFCSTMDQILTSHLPTAEEREKLRRIPGPPLASASTSRALTPAMECNVRNASRESSGTLAVARWEHSRSYQPHGVSPWNFPQPA